MSAEQSPPGGRTVVVGLIADPGVAAEVADDIAEDVPEQLQHQMGDDISWDVQVRHEALPLGDEGQIMVVDGSENRMRHEGWDMMICLTELPRRVDTAPHVFDLSVSQRAALVSLPSLGWLRLRLRTSEAVAYVVRRIAEPMLGMQPDGDSADRRLPTRPLTSAREEPGKEDFIESHVALSGFRGRLRLLLGMVRTNRPWRLVPSLSTAIAAALGIAAFGIFYSSIWMMAVALSPLRLAFITSLAVGVMMVWLIAYNGLWERRSAAPAHREAGLYNMSTIVTLFIGVMCMYFVLWAVMLALALVVIDTEFLEATLEAEVNPGDYVKITWLACSMGTVAGAVGSSLESEHAVQQATYSKRAREYRERRDAEDPSS